MSSLDDLFTITCNKCNVGSPALAWTECPISGDLPPGEFQCPVCGHAFRRQRCEGESYRQINGAWTYAPIELIPIPTRL